MTPQELFLVLLMFAAVAASLGGLRWAYHRPRWIQVDVYHSAEEVRLEVGRLQAVNVGRFGPEFPRMVLRELKGKQDPETGIWTVSAIWTGPEERAHWLYFRPGVKFPREGGG